MEKSAFVTGADRGLGLALCAGLLEKGWRVLAGQYMPDWSELNILASTHPGQLSVTPLDVTSLDSARQAARAAAQQLGRLDLLISNAGVNSPKKVLAIEEGLDYGDIHRLYDVNAAGPLRIVESFLPLMEASSLKRLCFVSSEAGSITACRRDSWYGYCMSKAALNMGAKILFNDLHSRGYTFCVYHPGWIRSYITGTKNPDADLEPEEAAAKALQYFLADANEENRLVLIDYQGVEWPW